jgi:hypothetical protein
LAVAVDVETYVDAPELRWIEPDVDRDRQSRNGDRRVCRGGGR